MTSIIKNSLKCKYIPCNVLMQNVVILNGCEGSRLDSSLIAQNDKYCVTRYTF